MLSQPLTDQCQCGDQFLSARKAILRLGLKTLHYDSIQFRRYQRIVEAGRLGLLGHDFVNKRPSPRPSSYRFLPVNIRYINTPRLYKSARESMGSPVTCSGAMYAGVPTKSPSRVSVVTSSSSLSLTIPKSKRCILHSLHPTTVSAH
jgi:hypothetical protein